MELLPTNIPYPNLSLPIGTFEREIIAFMLCVLVLLGWLVYRNWKKLEQSWTVNTEVIKIPLPSMNPQQSWQGRFIKLDSEDTKFLENFERNVRSYLGEIHQVPLNKSLTTAELRKYAPREWMPLLTKLHNLRYQDVSKSSVEQNKKLLELVLSLIS